MNSLRQAVSAGAVTLLAASAAHAESLRVRVTVQNLAPGGSIAFAPLHVGFHGGTFDAFDEGSAATAPIISVAEGGSGSDWFPAFQMADAGATLGTALPDPAGPLLAGATGQGVFMVDPMANPFFTFASMVIPSNDYFIGNDDPQAYRLFDGSGNLLIPYIDLLASDIWDAGSEADDPAAAAFIVGGDNDLRTPQNGVVSFDFAGLSIFDGLLTAGGYVFESQLAADIPIYRIGFRIVEAPEPGTIGLMLAGLGLLGALRVNPNAQRTHG
ncbi:MAG: hypothetical protein RLZ98_3620 [Pseudomonadota bacterium]